MIHFRTATFCFHKLGKYFTVITFMSKYDLFISNAIVLAPIPVPGSIPGGVNRDFFRGSPDRTMRPEVDSVSESEYQGFLLG